MTVLVSTHYMDEAERCHAIAYLAYGRLLAQGSVAQVIERAGLTTLTVEATGPDSPIAALARALTGRPGIDLVAPFGAALHVGGADRDRLLAALAPLRDDPAFAWREDSPTLEDAFIHLMQGAHDPFAPKGDAR
jgi:ABC-2 type transport system ATP-binding protein